MIFIQSMIERRLRFYIWKALKCKENIPYGVGTGEQKIYLKTNINKSLEYFYNRDTCHNQYLQILLL